MGSGRLSEFSLSNRDEAQAGYETPKSAPNLPLLIQNISACFYFSTISHKSL